MKVTWLISDTHFNHDNIATYCNRPANFTDLLIRRWQAVVKPGDLVIHLGDVAIGNRRKVKDILAELPGRKVLVLGNHDRMHGPDWWMEQGFDFACQALKYRNVWLTHEPSTSLADGCEVNVHGHLHNFMEKDEEGRVKAMHGIYKPKSFHLLFAVEYTNYFPVNFDKFVAHPERFKADIYAQFEGLKLRKKLDLL